MTIALFITLLFNLPSPLHFQDRTKLGLYEIIERSGRVVNLLKNFSFNRIKLNITPLFLLLPVEVSSDYNPFITYLIIFNLVILIFIGVLIYAYFYRNSLIIKSQLNYTYHIYNTNMIFIDVLTCIIITVASYLKACSLTSLILFCFIIYRFFLTYLIVLIMEHYYTLPNRLLIFDFELYYHDF